MRSYTLDFRVRIGRGHHIAYDHTGRWWRTDTWPDLNLDRRQVTR